VDFVKKRDELFVVASNITVVIKAESVKHFVAHQRFFVGKNNQK